MEVRQHNSLFYLRNRFYLEQHVSAVAIVRFQFSQLTLVEWRWYGRRMMRSHYRLTING
jgi:hypothetical protein